MKREKNCDEDYRMKMRLNDEKFQVKIFEREKSLSNSGFHDANGIHSKSIVMTTNPPLIFHNRIFTFAYSLSLSFSPPLSLSNAVFSLFPFRSIDLISNSCETLFNIHPDHFHSQNPFYPGYIMKFISFFHLSTFFSSSHFSISFILSV